MLGRSQAPFTFWVPEVLDALGFCFCPINPVPALTGGPQLLSPDALPGVFQLGVGVTELTNLDLARLHVVDYKRSIWICHQCVLDLWPRWFGDRDQRPTFEGPLGCQYRW